MCNSTELEDIIEEALADYHALDQLVHEVLGEFHRLREGTIMRWTVHQTMEEALAEKQILEQSGRICTDPVEVLIGAPPRREILLVSFREKDFTSKWGSFWDYDGEEG